MDLGITGQDQVSEYEADASSVGASGVVEVLNLGFGKCKLQVQVPEESKFQSARDLIGHRLATSFMGLTERFFAKLEGTNGQSANGEAVVVGKLKTKIRSLGGSVETACTLGVADGIVDLVGECHLPCWYIVIGPKGLTNSRVGGDDARCRPEGG